MPQNNSEPWDFVLTRRCNSRQGAIAAIDIAVADIDRDWVNFIAPFHGVDMIIAVQRKPPQIPCHKFKVYKRY